MLRIKCLTFLISISMVNCQAEFSFDNFEGSGSDCHKNSCVLEINNRTDELLKKIENVEKQNDEGQRKIFKAQKDGQQKIWGALAQGSWKMETKINDTIDTLVEKIKNMEKQNNEANRKITEVTWNMEKKITDENKKAEEKMTEVIKENEQLKDDLANLQNKLSELQKQTILQEVKLSELQLKTTSQEAKLLNLQEKTDSQEACFEDLTNAKCFGSKSGKVGIIETIRVEGGWSQWSPWSNCSTTCGQRERSCNNPAPLHGGKPCPGENMEKRQCDVEKCCVEAGMTPFGKHCYRFVDTPKTWTQAEEHCKSNFGANLVSITSQEEQEFVSNLTQKKGSWIGGTDAEREGTFVWTDGTLWTYSAWHKGEPNDTGGREDYVHIRKGGINWNDHVNDESQKFPFTCKMLPF